MAFTKDDEDSADEKRTIEFDMFVRDYETDQHEKIHGDGKSRKQQTLDDGPAERPR